MRPYEKQPKSNEELVALLQSRGLAADTRQRTKELASAVHLPISFRHGVSSLREHVVEDRLASGVKREGEWRQGWLLVGQTVWK